MELVEFFLALVEPGPLIPLAISGERFEAVRKIKKIFAGHDMVNSRSRNAKGAIVGFRFSDQNPEFESCRIS